MPTAHTFTLVHVPAGEDRRLCKVISPQGTAAIDDLPYLCTFEEVAVDSPAALLLLLDQLSGDQNTCILRARLKPGTEQPCRRITADQQGDAATLDDVARAWVLIDLDSLECPEGIDFCAEPNRAAMYVRNSLPVEFRTAACVWRASSNAGLKEGIRLHLWFLLSAELDTARLTHWLRNVKCDKATFRANLPHFTADPLFVGREDPMARRRGTLQGSPRVVVPSEIEQFEGETRAPREASRTTDADPFKAAALRRWEDANPFDEPSSSERLECPACGSPDGVAVREDGRWNCHSSRHVDESPAIGTHTGSVYVGHRIEFQEGLTARDVIPWLKSHGFWQSVALGGKFTGRSERRPSNAVSVGRDSDQGDQLEPNSAASDTASAIADTMGALATGEIKPSLREYARAADQLKRAVGVVMASPGKLGDVAEECARWCPAFLDVDNVVRSLRDAAVRAPVSVALTADVAEAVIANAFERGAKRPHRPRAARNLDDGPQLPLDEHGQPARCLAAVYYFCTRPAVMSAIALDDRSHRVVVIEAPPWWADDDREFPRQLEDADLPRLSAFIGDRFGYPHSGTKDLLACLSSVAQDRRWDPFEDYLDGLTWEGTSDEARELLGGVPATLLGADDSPYSARVFMRWLIAAVQRTYEPGCQFREVLTLIGPQNIGKSKFFRLLCADPTWFSDTVAADGSQNSRSALDGKVIVEFAELDKHMRDDRTGAFKNYISTQIDSYRRAYAHVDQDMRRRCVFCATSNHTDLFVDPTGNTRFNVLTVRSIDDEGVVEFRDQLWAAARHLYQEGEPSYLQGEEREWAAAVQAQHYNESSPEALVRELWEQPAPAATRVQGGVAGKNELGFDYDPAQLDSERRWLVLTTSQIRAYLLERGARGTNIDRTIRMVCASLGLQNGRAARALTAVANARSWGRDGCGLLVRAV